VGDPFDPSGSRFIPKYGMTVNRSIHVNFLVHFQRGNMIDSNTYVTSRESLHISHLPVY